MQIKCEKKIVKWQNREAYEVQGVRCVVNFLVNWISAVRVGILQQLLSDFIKISFVVVEFLAIYDSLSAVATETEELDSQICWC